jgi:hypothetical protein
MTNWKAHERRIAKRLSGRRVGNAGKPTPDVLAAGLVIECKHRASLPKWLTAAVSSICGKAQAGQLAIVVLHEKGKRSDNDLVVMRLSDFQNSLPSGKLVDKETVQ